MKSDEINQIFIKEHKHRFDQIVYKLYGLTDEEISIVEQSLKGL